MKVLFIGGTGTISVSVSKLAVARGIDLTLLNRGKRGITIDGAKTITADITQTDQIEALLGDQHFDSIVNWIAFHEAEVERDIALFREHTNQYIFISSASAYQKPVTDYVITESTPLANPYWNYSREKIACEERLMRAYREEGFPMTIVRPSHTYDKRLPLAVGSSSYVVPQRMLDGKPVIIHGDGTSLWVLTHSEDFAKGFVGLLGHPQTIGQAFQITSDFVLTWNQIYEANRRCARREAEHRPHAVRVYRSARPASGRGHHRRQDAQRRLRQQQDQALRPRLRGDDPLPSRRAPLAGVVSS